MILYLCTIQISPSLLIYCCGLSRWCHQLKARRHARECVSAIPSLPPLLPLSAQAVAKQLLPGETIINRGSLKVEERVADYLETERIDLEEKRFLKKILCKFLIFHCRRRFSAPLDLHSLLSHHLLVTRPPSLPPLSHSHHTSPHIYWSLALLHMLDLSPCSDHLGDREMLGFLEQKLKFCPLPGTESEGGRKLFTDPGVREISHSETPLPGYGGLRQLKIAVKSVRIDCHGDDCRGDGCRVFCGVCAVVLLSPTPRSNQTPEVYM